MLLEGKVAIVTGGGNGIGKATAQRFAAEGANVVIFDLADKALSETRVEMNEAGQHPLTIVGDVTNRADVQQLVDTTLTKFGRLDILINNAGINLDGLTTRIKDGDIRFMSDEKWEKVIDVNLKGTWICSQISAVPMIEQQNGRIVNTSSIGALGNIGQANYAASKAGVIGLTKTLALEWARYNIAVNCIAPGATHSRMTAGIPEKIMQGLIAKIPFRRLANPEEIANAHLFFASSEAAYITGQVLFVDGGISVGV